MGALGGLFQGMLAGKQLRQHMQAASDAHNQLQQEMALRQQMMEMQQNENTFKTITNRMNLQAMGAKPVNNGMVDDMLSWSPDSQGPASPSPSGNASPDRGQTAKGPGDYSTSPLDTTGQNNPSLDQLRSQAGGGDLPISRAGGQPSAAPGVPQNIPFTRKAGADGRGVVTIPWIGGQKEQYELPTQQEQIQRQAQMADAAVLREKYGLANANQHVIAVFGKSPSTFAQRVLNLPPDFKVMPGEDQTKLEGEALKAYQGGFRDTGPGAALINTNPNYSPAPGGAPAPTATGQPGAAPGGQPGAPGGQPGQPGVVFRNPPLEDPGTRAARGYTAEVLGKKPEDVTYEELAKGKADWERESMNPIERKLKEGEIAIQPLTAQEKKSQISTQALQRQIHTQELDLAGDPDTINMAAQRYLQTNTMPALGMGSQLLRGKIMGRAAEIAKENGLNPENIPALQDSYKALSASLTDMQKRQGQILAFEKGGAANLDNFMRLAKQQIDSGSPLINRTLRGGARTLTGSPDQAAADTARIAAFNEISKILSGSLGNAGVSDAGRSEAEKLLNGDYTMPQLLKVAGVLRQDMKNRSDAYGQQITSIRQQMQGLTKPGGGKISVTAPDGSVHPFDTQEQADQFKKLAGIK